MARRLTSNGTRSTRPWRTPAAGSWVHRGTAGVVDHALHNHADHFIPWVVLGWFWLAGTVLHALISTAWSQVGTVALILLGTGVMVWSVHHTNRTRTATARWHGILTTLFGGLWLALCTITGFITFDPDPTGLWQWGDHTYSLTAHGFTIATYFALGVTSAAIWNTRINARHRQVEFEQWLAQQTPDTTPMERAGHKGAKLTLRRVDQWRSEGTLILADGDTLERFQKDLAAVETAHGFPPDSMTVTRRRGVSDARICDVTVMHGNPIEQAQPWPGLPAGAR